MASDPKWELDFWFDFEADYTRLREMQRYSGPQTVQACKELFIGDNRNRLLGAVSLMALVCGAGKTLQIVATMLHINRVVREQIGKGPRCSRALWFVKERSAANQLEGELNEEIVKFGLHHRKPTVQICDESGDLERGPTHNDITISCPHALWERRNQRRSDEQIMDILAQYDVIIWDECDFAISQIQRLVRLSPHAIKFGLTASPIDGDGDVLSQLFVLAGIASYQDVFENDRCLKNFLPWDDAKKQGYVRAFSHRAYTELTAGFEAPHLGQHFDRHSLPGAWAAISTAMSDCLTLEIAMRQEWPEHWYSPHIFVVTDSRSHADDVCGYINNYLRDYHREYPIADGWRALAMYDGYGSKETPREERALVHRDPAVVHPFMRAKTLNGRCDRQCARIIVVVDMAIRALNNWPILYTVDIKRSSSVNVQVQLKGRGSRLPSRLSPLTFDPRFPRFCTDRYYFPESGNNVSVMKQAYDFTWEFKEKLIASDLPHWSDLLAGHSIETDFDPQPTADPFTLTDRLEIDGQLARIKERDEPLTEDVIDAIVDGLPGDQVSKGRAQRARDHIQRVTDPSQREYRRKFVNPDVQPLIVPVATETPDLDPSPEVLRSFLIGRSKFRELAEEILPRLETDPLWQQAIKIEFVADHEKHYLPLPKLYQLYTAHGKRGILTGMAASLKGDLLRSRAIDPETPFGELAKAVAIATSDLTGITDTSNDGLLDHPSYHYVLALPHNQSRIKARAIGLLVKRKVLSRLTPLYEDVIDDE